MSDYHARYSREKSAEVAEIGPLPAVVHPRRKALCRGDLLLFLQSYFPESTGLSPFSPAHVEFIDDLQHALLHGGRVARAVFRGFSKTTIGELSCLWALLYGHKKFVPLVGGDQAAARNNLRSIKAELATNELLLADFPEVCHPVQALEGKVQRCASQTLNGSLTRMSWTSEHVVLPDVPGSPAAGGCLMTLGITAFRRGLVHKGADGTQHRPDFVFVDDPQTDRSAKSESQIAEREHVLSAAILKSAGHAKPMAAFVAGTIIYPGDMMDRLTDPDVSPSWRAKRVPMVGRFADAHETLWLEEYAAIRRNFDRDIPGDQQRAEKAATDFYAANRAAMDAGAKITWASCYNRTTELSAVQHAYNLLIDDGEETFAAECQNDPVREKGDLERPTHGELARKQNGCRQGLVPHGVEWLTAFVDVQGAALYWCVVGWESSFSGHIVDYGVWPRQKRRTFRLASMKQTLKKVCGSQDLTAAIYNGLVGLFRDELAPEWKREDGATMRLTVAAIDANWGDSGEAVRGFCRDAQVAFPVMPAIGRGITAAQRPMAEWPKQNGQRKGDGWVITKPKGRVVRTLLTDTNTWKTRVTRGLALPQMAAGSIDLFRADTASHRELCEQLLAETPKQTHGSGRTLFEWVNPPGADNHFFDCLVGCAALASVAGVARPGTVVRPSRKGGRRKVRYAS